MQIAVIGAGNVGTALGSGWSAAGHLVTYGVRNPTDQRYAGHGGKFATIGQAVAGAEVVVLATPWPAIESALAAAGDLSGKTLIDCTNPLVMDAQGLHLALGHTTSCAEKVAALAPGASVFKAFNTTGAENMARAGSFPTPPVMFVAGDDAAKKPMVITLARDLGFDPVDAGPLLNARLLEPLAMLWIDLALKRGAGRDFAFALVRRKP